MLWNQFLSRFTIPCSLVIFRTDFKCEGNLIMLLLQESAGWKKNHICIVIFSDFTGHTTPCFMQKGCLTKKSNITASNCFWPITEKFTGYFLWFLYCTFRCSQCTYFLVTCFLAYFLTYILLTFFIHWHLNKNQSWFETEV